MGRYQPEGDSLCRLSRAHSAITQILLKVDGLVQKANKSNAPKQITGCDLRKLSELLEGTASSLEEWIARVEYGGAITASTDDVEIEKDGLQSSLPACKALSEEATRVRDSNSFLSTQSKVLTERMEETHIPLDGKGNLLSDSPLLPWLDKGQIFVLTPMAKPKQNSWSVLVTTRTGIGQDILKTAAKGRLGHSHSGIIPVDLSPSLDACADTAPQPANSESPPACKSPVGEPQAVLKDAPLSPSAASPSQLVQQGAFERTETIDIASPSCFQSLVKRYSHYFETKEDFSDSSCSPPATPTVTQKQDADEGMEITQYFTAFSPPKSLAPYISRSGSSSTEDSSPKGKAGGSRQKPSTPMPFQSIMKRYSRCLRIEEERIELAESSLTLTPMLACSPPKTCVLMRPNWKDSSKTSLQTPVLLLKSPCGTPAFKLSKTLDHSFYEDMELTSLKKPLQLPLPLALERTPSSDMQFATIKKSLNAINRTPFVGLQLSTVRKIGARLPGEQTLKRELWCRMEAEFASMTHLCKSLFDDTQM